MQVHILKSKILRAEITNSSLHYEGSMAIDSAILKAAGILPYEKILVGNINNGERFETYAIPAPEGSHIFSLNGGTARLGQIGDLVVIMTFAAMSPEEYAQWKPTVVVLSEKNSKMVVK